ncbi:MAG TPA: hypothetical protein VNC22_00290, partial [Sporichthya sp.]|nr:hypothetical protein [Sporichthya sp.]
GTAACAAVAGLAFLAVVAAGDRATLTALAEKLRPSRGPGEDGVDRAAPELSTSTDRAAGDE